MVAKLSILTIFILQNSIHTGTRKFGPSDISHEEFCYKPISGKGCLVTSPMQYWQTNLTRLLADPDVKKTSQCIPPENATERVCFDEIGVPVMPYTILGNQ